MPRYIDADALLKEAKRLSGPQTGDGWDNWGVYALIERQPTADVQPVEKAHNDATDYADSDQFVCSVCGIELQDWHRVERNDDGEETCHEYVFRFCPNCGAKMEG